MAASLQGKTAVVTGGSQGIGRQISLNLAKQGASVVVNCSSNKQKADEVVSQIESEHGKAIAVQGEVSTVRQGGRNVRQSAHRRELRRNGTLQLSDCCAGI
jgi:3-oxoacyl-[acyl-carrier protein] reductase